MADILAEFLGALGVPGEWIPATIDGRVAKYRSRTAAKDVLVVLDDVAKPAQLRCLIPASASSMVVATRRIPFEDAFLNAGSWVRVTPLKAEHGLELLRHSLSPQRVEADLAGAHKLVQACGGMPLALKIASQRLLRRPQQTMTQLAEVITVDLFDDTYAELSDAAKKCFLVLGVLPGRAFEAGVVAYAAEIGPADAVDALGELFEAGLVDGEYFVHDIVRADARTRLADPAGLATRVVDWYAASVANADRSLMGPNRLRLGTPPALPGQPFTSQREAWAWLLRENVNLHLVLEEAARLGQDDTVWTMVESLWPLHWLGRAFSDWIHACDLGVAATQRLGLRDPAARLLSQRARARLELGELDLAWRDLQEAGELVSNRRVLASVIEFKGFAHLAETDLAAAFSCFKDALDLNVELGQNRGTALQLNHLGLVLRRLGRPAEALERLDEAEVILKELDDRQALVPVLLEQAGARHDLGMPARAAAENAIDLAHQIGLIPAQARGWELLAEITGDRSYLRRALDLHDKHGGPSTDRLRTALSDED